MLNSYSLYENLLIFKYSKAHQMGELYWTISPMPTTHQLAKFYKKVYWQKYRSNSIAIIKERDIEHFGLIKSKINIDFLNTVVNFGCGPGGGISHLFFANGKTVINIEPGLFKNFYSEKQFMHYVNLWDIPKNLKVDLLYGSHSLEHVQNVSKIEKFIRNQLNSGRYVFWGVPNGLHANSGPLQNKIVPPHTYYFTRKYFDSLGLKSILNATFSGEKLVSGDSGNVIRFLGVKE